MIPYLTPVLLILSKYLSIRIEIFYAKSSFRLQQYKSSVHETNLLELLLSSKILRKKVKQGWFYAKKIFCIKLNDVAGINFEYISHALFWCFSG